MLTFCFVSCLGLMYRYSGHPCVFLDPGQNSLTISKPVNARFHFFQVHLAVRVLEAAEFTADEVNFVRGHSHRLSVL